MRKEASLEQWGTLYEIATRIKEHKPWEKFWDMDLIGIRTGAAEDTVFFSILGRGGECYGITVYEGYAGLNRFLMLAMQQELHLSSDYAMFEQRNLTCYWGNREELTDKQRKTIKELGYSYRGKNQWLYFLSFEPGYYPYNMDEEEVLRMSGHLQNLESALQRYEREPVEVDFESANMLLATFAEDTGDVQLEEARLPFTSYQFGELRIEDEKLLSNLAAAPRCKAVLEAEVAMMGAEVTDKKYSRPAHPALVLLGDAASGAILDFYMSEPEDEPMISLAEMVVEFVTQHGAPREIKVSNMIVEASLTQLCQVCGIKLSRVKRLPAIDSFRQSMRRFG